MSFNDAAFVAIHFRYMSIDEVIKLSKTLTDEKKEGYFKIQVFLTIKKLWRQVIMKLKTGKLITIKNQFFRGCRYW